jgi:hypothetical protein
MLYTTSTFVYLFAVVNVFNNQVIAATNDTHPALIHESLNTKIFANKMEKNSFTPTVVSFLRDSE